MPTFIQIVTFKVWDLLFDIPDQWKNHDKFIYYIFLFSPWIFFKNKFKGYLLFFISILTYCFSIQNQKIGNAFYQWESLWCFLGVIIPVLFMVLTFI